MPSKRKLHVGYNNFGSVWCGAKLRNIIEQKNRIIAAVHEWTLAANGPPDLSADDRVCKRCVQAMNKAWEAQRTETQ